MRHRTSFGGVPYIVFLAPGLIAAQAMQTGRRNRRGRSSRASVEPDVRGDDRDARGCATSCWATAADRRSGLVTGVFLIGAFFFGAITSPTAIFAWPAASSRRRLRDTHGRLDRDAADEQSFSIIFRFIITPLFLFSGTFFPIEQLPNRASDAGVVHAALPRRGAVPRLHAGTIGIRSARAAHPCRWC